MKRLWIAAALLGAVFAATLWNSHHLQTFATGITDLLSDAEIQAEEENWGDAASLTQQARAQWEARNCYLHITLRHSDTDAVYTGFREVQELINFRERGEYSAANARLIAELRLICESEKLTLENIL